MSNFCNKLVVFFDVVFDEDVVDLLCQIIGDDEEVVFVCLFVGGGYFGYGLYLVYVEYQEEGVVLLCFMLFLVFLKVGDEVGIMVEVLLVEDLLVMVVECGLVCMFKVMDVDL